MTTASSRADQKPFDARVAWFPAWPYADALAWMQAQWEAVSAGGPMVIGVGEHAPAVVTLGRHAPDQQIQHPQELAELGVDVVRTDRGGGATLHQPGQLVLYPVVDLGRLKLSVPAFTQLLLGAAQDLLAFHGIKSELIEGLPGVYVRGRKIASVGFRSRRRVVTHGLALNVCNELSLFAHIHPCGDVDRDVTSIGCRHRKGRSTRDT
jgi:lipoate-protein ligase B